MSTKELVREIERAEKKVARLRGKLLRGRLSDAASKREQALVIQTTGGSLKKKMKIDPVKWQQNIRAEWGR